MTRDRLDALRQPSSGWLGLFGSDATPRASHAAGAYVAGGGGAAAPYAASVAAEVQQGDALMRRMAEVGGARGQQLETLARDLQENKDTAGEAMDVVAAVPAVAGEAVGEAASAVPLQVAKPNQSSSG